MPLNILPCQATQQSSFGYFSQLLDYDFRFVKLQIFQIALPDEDGLEYFQNLPSAALDSPFVKHFLYTSMRYV
jgi:hypothetical protein